MSNNVVDPLRVAAHGRPLADPSVPRVRLPAALLALSGAAALIYQVVWFQLLTLVIGASALSLGVLLATFMGGMCVGALAFARIVSKRRDPFLVYAAIEAAIAISGVLVLLGLPALADIYGALANDRVLPRMVLASFCLLPPTVLIGATLPALARAVRADGGAPSGLGAMYAANLAGAVVGALLAGFYLLRVHDVAVATAVAAGLNCCSALGSLVAAMRLRRRPDNARHSAAVVPTAAAATSEPASPVLAAIALSGFTALAAEVLWTRHLALLLGGTVYTFALILAVFLLGLGLGSAAGTAAARSDSARTLLAACQAALCSALGWAAWALARSLPYWPLDVTLATAPGVALQLDLLRVSFAILPAAVLWGASFPLALAAAKRTTRDPSRLVADVYVANTLGAIAGALATTFVLVTALGSTATQQLMIGVSGLSAALLVLTHRTHGNLRGKRLGRLAAVMLAGLLSGSAVPDLPGELVALGRFLPTRAAGVDVVYVGEGRTASVAVSRQQDGALTYHNAGKTQASTYPQDMRLQRMLGHLTTLTADAPRSVLVIGLGAGITAGAVSIDPAVERVVIAELEPLAAHVAGTYFEEQNFDVLGNPKVELVVDDGRHYLATTEETFDAITSDPLDPWVKGAAALYTSEFWQLARARLNSGGVVTVFLQLYETTGEAVKSELATFFEVFPNGALFANTVDGAGYDAVLLARAGDAPIDVDGVAARLRSGTYGPVARSLSEVGFESAADLLGTYAAHAQDLRGWLADAELNTDRSLRLQYLAGEGLNLYIADAIFANVRGANRAELPPSLFTGSPGELAAIGQRVRARSGGY